MNLVNQTTINNSIDLGKKATPFVGLYFVGKLVMDALNNSGHNFSNLKHLESLKAVHLQKLAWAGIFIILLLVSLIKK